MNSIFTVRFGLNLQEHIYMCIYTHIILVYILYIWKLYIYVHIRRMNRKIYVKYSINRDVLMLSLQLRILDMK